MCSNVAALLGLAVLVTHSAAALSYSLRQHSLRVAAEATSTCSFLALKLYVESIQNLYRFSFLNGSCINIIIVQLQIDGFFPL